MTLDLTDTHLGAYVPNRYTKNFIVKLKRYFNESYAVVVIATSQ